MSGVYSIAYVRGLQGEHPRYVRANAGCKHFDVYAGPENIPESRFSFNAKVNSAGHIHSLLLSLYHLLRNFRSMHAAQNSPFFFIIPILLNLRVVHGSDGPAGRVGSRFCQILAGRVESALRIFNFLIIYWYLNRYESSKTAFGLIDFLRYIQYIIIK